MFHEVPRSTNKTLILHVHCDGRQRPVVFLRLRRFTVISFHTVSSNCTTREFESNFLREALIKTTPMALKHEQDHQNSSVHQQPPSTPHPLHHPPPPDRNDILRTVPAAESGASGGRGGSPRKVGLPRCGIRRRLRSFAKGPARKGEPAALYVSRGTANRID